MKNYFKHADLADKIQDYNNLRELFYEDLDGDRNNLVETLEKIRLGELVEPSEIKDFAEDLLEYYKKITGNSHPVIDELINRLREI
jgi:hypothetical protein